MTEPRDPATEDWTRAARRLAAGQATLVSLWGDVGCVRMALHDHGRADLTILTLPCPDGGFPSVGAVHPPAIRLELSSTAAACAWHSPPPCSICRRVSVVR